MKPFILILLSVLLTQIAYSEKREELELSEIKVSDKVEKDHLYYRVYRDEKKIHLQLINAYGGKLFARKYDLITGPSFYIEVPDKIPEPPEPVSKELFLETYNEYVLLPYHPAHSDGSICGWQIKSCGSYTVPVDAKEDGWVQIGFSIYVFFGDLGEYRTLHINYQSILSDIEMISNQPEQDNPITRP